MLELCEYSQAHSFATTFIVATWDGRCEPGNPYARTHAGFSPEDTGANEAAGASTSKGLTLLLLLLLPLVVLLLLLRCLLAGMLWRRRWPKRERTLVRALLPR